MTAAAIEGREPPEGDPENPYEAPGESKAGRGGIVSPGGSQPQPTEDPRKDSGVHEPEPKDDAA